MTRTQQRLAGSVVLIVAVVTATGCASFGDRRAHRATSVVEYLFPGRAGPVATVATAVLAVPLRVGIAFAPEQGGASNVDQAAITEEKKVALLREIAGHFKKDFVESIELIPTSDLTPGGGFADLDQLRRTVRIDVIALLSYDQVQFTNQDLLSLTYWTLLGLYVVPGEKNDTRTVLDAAVLHIPSRKLLFRAQGTSQVKRSATPINLEKKLRRDGEAGFTEAAKDLEKKLDERLALFQERLKKAPEELQEELKSSPEELRGQLKGSPEGLPAEAKSSPEEFKVVRKRGYTGGGALDAFTVALAAGLGGYALWARGRRRR